MWLYAWGAMEMSHDAAKILLAIDGLLPAIEAVRGALDVERRLPDDLVAALADAGVFSMSMPRALGGLELPPLEMAAVVERISWADGAVGWVAAIGSGTAAYVSSRLPVSVAASIWADARTVVCGSMAIVGGMATVVPRGFRVTGRWPFGSGTSNSDWIASACSIADGAEGGTTGPAAQRVVLVPKKDCQLLDTWDVVGLRGTGSTDYTLTDVFVPEEFAIDRAAPAVHDGPSFRHRFYLLGHAPHALGVAQRAIDAFEELARVKADGRVDRVLAGRASVQSDMAEAHALVGMARAYFREVVGEAWETVCAGDPLDLAQQGRVRLAITSCVRNAVRAIDMLYEAAGASSIYETSPLARCFRDIHVASQHAVVQKSSYATSGQTILGVDTAAPFVF